MALTKEATRLKVEPQGEVGEWRRSEGCDQDEDTLNAEVNPSSGQVREGNTPFLFALIDVGFEQKLVDSTNL